MQDSSNLMQSNYSMRLLDKMARFTFALIDTSLGARKRELLLGVSTMNQLSRVLTVSERAV